MSFKIRRAITEQIVELVKSDKSPYLLSNLPSIFELRMSGKAPELHLPVIKTRNLFEENSATLIKQIVDAKYDEQLIKKVSPVIKEKSSRAPIIVFQLNPNTFVEETLNQSQNTWTELLGREKRKYVVEFSSPNIAKPFHVGHLRSTIIGNVISNLLTYIGNDVTKLNYLGDWGTQFGMLQVGMDMIAIDEDNLKVNPIQSLYKAYVTANRAAKEDPKIAEKAREIFTKLEMNQTLNQRQNWEKIRKYTEEELKVIYNRLGVQFDEYAWESQYNQHEIQGVVSLLTKMDLLFDEIDGKKIVKVGERRVPVAKSDGSTLYLLRDIAALLDRVKKYKFDKIFYVVDNAQTDHFKACFHVVNQLEDGLIEKAIHIKFGRIKGMSTRLGNVVFLNDILDEARDIMMQKQIQSPTTKVDIQSLDPAIADILGVSAVIVNDLKQRRQKDYDFSWDKALQVNGDTGIKLQYTHCRLSSLMENVSISPAKTPQAALLNEPEAMDLILEIGRFEEVILKTEENLEPCLLVNYLFKLSNATSRALKHLNVKHESSSELQAQRMLLFSSAKKVLHSGMCILGLKPLNKM